MSILKRPPELTDLTAPSVTMQTATGMLDMMPTICNLNTPPGEPFNDELFKATMEYVDRFTVSSDDTFGKLLTFFEPLSVSEAIGSVTDYQSFMPIWMLPSRCSTFIDAIPRITFQAVKTMASVCELLVVYYPLEYPVDTELGNDASTEYVRFAHKKPFVPAEVPGIFTPEMEGRARFIKWKWDLAASDTFTIDFTGFTTAGLKLQRYNTIKEGRPTDPSDPPSQAVALPYENYSVGAVGVYLNQPYMPGSIFPTSFEVNIWKSFTKLDTYVYQSPHAHVLLSSAHPPFVV